MQVVIRKVGHLRGVLIPEPILVRLRLEDSADLQVRDGVMEIRPPLCNARVGWADDAHRLATHNDDVPVWPELADAGDVDLAW